MGKRLHLGRLYGYTRDSTPRSTLGAASSRNGGTLSPRVAESAIVRAHGAVSFSCFIRAWKRGSERRGS
jgi:hypothetical protein